MIHWPLSKEDFFKEILEKKPLHMANALAEWNDALFDLDCAIGVTNWDDTGFKLHDGGVIDKKNYTQTFKYFNDVVRRLDHAAFYSYIDRGASLIANHIDCVSPKFAEFCSHVGSFFDCTVVANGYFSKSDISPFGAHWDTHDVVACQLYGRKKWELFEPSIELPVINQPSRNFSQSRTSDPAFSVVLDAGDVLYVPRGWWHRVTGFGEATFHIACGVHPPLVSDYLQWAVSRLSLQSVEFRRAISGFFADEKLEFICNEFSRFIRNSERIKEFHLSCRNDLPIGKFPSSLSTLMSLSTGVDANMMLRSTLSDMDFPLDAGCIVGGCAYALPDPEKKFSNMLVLDAWFHWGTFRHQ